MYGELLKRLWVEQSGLQSLVSRVNETAADGMRRIETERKMIMDQLRGSYQRLEKLESEIKQLMIAAGEAVPEKKS